MIILNDLPKEHELRNTPLKEINAVYRWKKAMYATPWRSVSVGAPKLVNFTYNDLGDSWTLFDYWAVEDGTDTSM